MTSKTAYPFGVWRTIALTSAAALTIGASSLPAQAEDSIKVGVLLPLSGNFVCHAAAGAGSARR